MNGFGRTIALIGGGRWGRVHAINLSALLSPRDRVLWISRHNEQAQRAAVKQFPSGGPAFELLESVDQLGERRPLAALVVTTPDTHAAIAGDCLRAGMHVFVEKPLAFREQEARSLVELAAKSDRVLALGVHLLSASYLRHFKSQLAGRSVIRMSIRWFDPAHEIRHGEIKQADHSTPLVHDIYPHIWSIIRVLTGCSEPAVIGAFRQKDASILTHLSAGLVDIEACCGRDAPARERKIDIEFADGGRASIDFTEEPGLAMLDDKPLPPDPLWGAGPRPAMAEVSSFLDQISMAPRDPRWPHLASNCLASVNGAEVLSSKLSAH